MHLNEVNLNAIDLKCIPDFRDYALLVLLWFLFKIFLFDVNDDLFLDCKTLKH